MGLHQLFALIFLVSAFPFNLAVAEDGWPELGGSTGSTATATTTTTNTTTPSYTNDIPALGGGTASSSTGVRTVDLVAGPPPTSPFPQSNTPATAAATQAPSGCATTAANGPNAGLCKCLSEPQYQTDFTAFDQCVKAAMAGMQAGQAYNGGQGACNDSDPQLAAICRQIASGGASAVMQLLQTMSSGATVPSFSMTDGNAVTANPLMGQ